MSNNLKYAAAYYPWLKTSLPVNVGFSTLTIKRKEVVASLKLEDLLENNPLDPKFKAKDQARAAQNLVDDMAKVNGVLIPSIVTKFYGEANTDAGKDLKRDAILKGIADFKALTLVNTDASLLLRDYTITTTTVNFKKLDAIVKSLILAKPPAVPDPFKISELNATFVNLQGLITDFNKELENRITAIHTELRAKSVLYATIVSAAENTSIVLPPSGAGVGVYAAIDSARGVWKAPANFGLSNVIGPTVFMNDKDQEEINVDTNAGKSINAIRSFTGKGTLIWGARTLAGNDNEWRYVPVRRFFIMAEQSIKNATAQFVFEPNDANTWVRVRAMIENFLALQWEAGALAGRVREEAFFVSVGLGKTMTSEDVLGGYMIVEIGMAVVRPAEFIVLRFSHKMQES